MLRSTTNLVVPKDLQLDKKLLKTSFLYVYNKGYTGLEPVFINRLWMSTFFPEITANPTFGKNRKGLKGWSEYAAKNALAGLLSLRKVNDANDPHFVASVPLATFSRNDIHTVYSRYSFWFTDGKHLDIAQSHNALGEELQDTSNGPDKVAGRSIPGAKVVEAIQGLDAKGKHELAQTLLSLRLAFKGGLAVIFADFKIPKDIAQQLTTTDWQMIRNIDLYPLLLQWVVGQFGYLMSAPLASFPVSKIAKTLPKVLEGQARVNKEGLAIDSRGQALWLPEKLDNTSKYEDLFTQAGDKGDGSFSLLDITQVAEFNEGDEVKTRLPANIPVLIDWVNNKYAYTLSSGVMKVQDLSRFKAADASHIQALLRRLILTSKQLAGLSHMAGTAGIEPVVKFKAEEINEISQEDPVIARKLSAGPVPIMDYWDMAESYAMRFITDDQPIMMSELAADGNPIFRPIGRYFKLARAAMLQHLDAVNVKYSVSGVSVALGTLTLLSYADDPQIDLEANKINAAAQNQGIDPDWEPPSIPMLSDRIGMLPHQKKVRNIMKDSPNFAIVPVQAGGGKSVITITDVLYEIKANRSQPYLILCPPHLVAQYVKEIVFFTSGKLNVVPINTYTIFRNGFDRLTEMLEHAPRNTVVVCDYDVLRGRQRQVCYGTTSVTIYPVIEFLRQFNFGYAMLDESHSVKNDSQRTRACMILIADIPKKRLASGTMAHDSPSDLALQIAALDPTIFGSKTEFNDRFGSVVKGDRVVKWKVGAQQEIMRAIKSRVVVAGAMRKEWAALLPTAVEEFLGVELTEAQHQVYQAILTEALDKMREDAKTNKTLQKFFESRGEQIKTDVEDGEENDEAEDAADENAGGDLEALLGFYLARLEQFITAPTKDELGDKVLKGDDRISPKVTEIIVRIRLHLSQKLPGKVLVFTNYTDSAEEIYEHLPEDIKGQTLLYKAAEKVETGNLFENDDRYQVMVGVENSMNTGLNLQFVSRLIRTETVWNPGTLEQGNSRVNRPELKKADRRDKIYYDWIMANRTLDITKISRLISKVIAVAKFENTDNPAYEDIPEVEVIAMNVDSIQTMNSWETNIKEYGEAYRAYKQVQIADYAEYREKHGNLKLEPIAAAATPKDARMMANVPYTPGLEIFNAGQLGLVRVDEYLRMDTINGAEESEEEGEDDESGMTEKQKARARAAEALVGQAIHTEFGDGIIKTVRMKDKKINVTLNSGYMVRVGMAASFVMTKRSTNSKEMRTQLLQAVGDIPVSEKVKTLSPIFRPDNAALRRQEKEKLVKEVEVKQRKQKIQNISVELYVNVSNGFLGITYFVEDDTAKQALQALGFRPVPPYALAEVKNARQLVNQFTAWADKKFTLDMTSQKMGISDAFRALADALKSGAVAKGVTNYNFGTKNNLTNFFRNEVKPSISKNEIKPYPMIEDGKAYIVMHTRGQPAALRAMKVKVPGVNWKLGSDSMVFYGLDLSQTGQKIKEIMASGIQIANEDDLRLEFKKLKKTKLRKGEA